MKKWFLGMFDDDLEIRHRLLNLILFTVLVGSTLTMLVSIFLGIGFAGTSLTLALICVLALSLYLSSVKNKPNLAAGIAVVATDAIFFPYMYIVAGGIKSGMPIWFVLGLIFSWLVLRGWVSVVVYLICSVIMLGTIYYETIHPENIIPLDSGSYVLDVVQSIIFVTLIFGVIFKFQAYVYDKQRKKLEEQGRQLREALEATTIANQAKSDFLANMSHEIRTPINAVMGMNEMILRESNDPQISQYATNISSASNTLLTIINEILDFSKIESGKMDIIPKEYDLKSLFTDCYNMIISRAKGKGLEVRVYNDPSIPSEVYGDEVRIRQVICNILTNAVKYTDNGHIEMSVRYDEMGPEKIALIVVIKDTGHGISEENLKKLFGSFVRIDEMKNRNIEGTGLGLAITRRLVELMGGEITVQSTVGVGSTFTIRIPQEVKNDKPLGDLSKKIAEGNKTSYSYRKKFEAPNAKALVVDDVTMNLDVVRGLLKPVKIQIEVAESGQDALEMVKKNSYDIIFLDQMMPGLDGVDTLHMMRMQNLIPKDLPVIVLTANAIQGMKEKYIAEGFTDYVAKPAKGKDLEEMLLRYLPEDKITKDCDADSLENMIEKVNQMQARSSVEKKEDSVSEATARLFNESAGKDGDSDESAPSPELLKRFGDILDVETGFKYCMNEENFFIEMIKEYVKNMPKFKELKEAYEAKDMAAYKMSAHSIKSTSLTIGAVTLSELAKKSELSIKEGDGSYAMEHHEELVAAYEHLIQELQNKLN